MRVLISEKPYFMLERHNKLLAEVIRCYIRQAEPVGSKALEAKLGVSSATIRNDMAILEEQGLLRQPHTSAGRVPTAKGFQYYLDNLMQPKEPKPAEQKSLREIIQNNILTEAKAKALARRLASFSQVAALLAFSKDETYYTGLANLFQQPEFADISMVREIGQVVDHLDESLRQLWSFVNQRIEVKIGSENPLGEDCAIIYTHFHLEDQPILFGLLGPVRMDYEANIGRLNYVATITKN